MIKKVEIQNYRSCLDTSISLNPELSVLIGPNSSGKTNILNAILILQKLANERHQFFPIDRESTSESKLRVFFDIDGKSLILNIVANIYTDQGNNDVIVSSDQQWFVKDFTGSGHRIKTPLWLLRELTRSEYDENIYRRALTQRYNVIKNEVYQLPSSLIQPFSQITESLADIRYYSATQFTNPSRCPVSFEIEKEGTTSRSFGGNVHTKFLVDLYNIKNNPDQSRYEQFFEIVGPQGINLVDSIDFRDMLTSSIEHDVAVGGEYTQRKKEKILVIPQFRIGRNTLSPNQLSEGTFKTITLIFYLVTETSKILLIEEPEVCVHHGLLSSIIELIKTYSREKQIILSTHSDFVLDEVEPENVYKVSNDIKSGTKISHITKSMSPLELDALRDYLESDGNLGEYWRHGGLDN